MSDSLNSVYGHSLHFAKFRMLQFSKGYCSHRLIQFNQALQNVCNWGEIQAITFYGDLPNLKRHFEDKSQVHFVKNFLEKHGTLVYI